MAGKTGSVKRYIMAVDGEDVVFKVNNYDYYRLLPKTTENYRDYYHKGLP
jgi:hypothetical protein